MQNPPPLCIGLPVHNGGTYLSAALESLLRQSFADFEVVVSDNASTDATPDICLDFARRDPRIVYTRVKTNIGAGPNFNRVFHLCQSPRFKWMAHDDLLAPEALATLMAALDDRPNAVLSHSRLALIDDAARPLEVAADGSVLDHRGRPFHRLEPAHLAEGKRPSQRFGQALRRMNWCTAIFGIIRSDALARTHMHGSYYEADRVLLAELALLGRFVQVDDKVMIKRCHEGVSVLKPYRDQARMINPAVIPGPKGLRLRLGYLRALSVGELPWGERLACAVVVLRVTGRNRIVRRFLDWLRRRSPGGEAASPDGRDALTTHPVIPIPGKGEHTRTQR
ncbi:MAG TPA: glycosyltransferase family A protein [Magnetospirillum sp.]|jgi:glycosyltransferase involved in cell wall biosynthesis|nr:glycosyltransferase family A protein [Magnetospirillum sp.]